MYWRWLPLLLHIYSCAATYSSDVNYFTSPDYTPNNATRVYVMGSILNVSWHTNLTNYSMRLWQEFPDSKGAQPSVTTVYNQTGSDPDITSFNWTVTPYELDFDLSHKFFFWINGQIPSAYFKIYPSPTASITSSASQSATSPTTTSSSSAASSPAAPTTVGSNTSSSDSTAVVLGLGVGLGVGLPLAILCGVCMGFKMRRRQDHIDAYGQRQAPSAPQGSRDQAMMYTRGKFTPAPSEMASPPTELYAPPSELDLSIHTSELQGHSV